MWCLSRGGLQLEVIEEGEREGQSSRLLPQVPSPDPHHHQHNGQAPGGLGTVFESEVASVAAPAADVRVGGPAGVAGGRTEAPAVAAGGARAVAELDTAGSSNTLPIVLHALPNGMLDGRGI